MWDWKVSLMFHWKEMYSIGIPTIDAQHKKLLDIGLRLQALKEKSISDEALYEAMSEILKELQAYTAYHFSYEEELMREFDFPLTEKHIRAHVFFIQKLAQIDEQEMIEDLQGALNETLKLLADWLIDHIIVEDKKYVSCFENHKVG